MARHPAKVKWDLQFAGTNPSNRFARLRYSAKKRGIECSLTKAEWSAEVLGASCSYCSGPIEPTGSGLDRIDSSLGYIPGNILPACYLCNIVKGPFFSSSQMHTLGQIIGEWRTSGALTWSTQNRSLRRPTGRPPTR